MLPGLKTPPTSQTGGNLVTQAHCPANTRAPRPPSVTYDPVPLMIASHCPLTARLDGDRCLKGPPPTVSILYTPAIILFPTFFSHIVLLYFVLISFILCSLLVVVHFPSPFLFFFLHEAAFPQETTNTPPACVPV